MNNELMNRGLPKWPQMVVTGERLTTDRALEIICRTDEFFDYQSGNNHGFIEKARKVLGMPEKKHYWDNEFKKTDGTHNDEKYNEWSSKYYEDMQEWKEKWGVIYTEYVTNDWISSSFIKGAHGWCHPDGVIYFEENVGKWPSVQEIYDEWSLLAKEFPFLKVGVTLMDREESELGAIPVVSMKIDNGKVTLVDPQIEDIHVNHERQNRKESMERILMRRLTDMSSENAISLNTLKKWHDNVFFTITNGIVETLEKQRSYLK